MLSYNNIKDGSNDCYVGDNQILKLFYFAQLYFKGLIKFTISTI